MYNTEDLKLFGLDEDFSSDELERKFDIIQSDYQTITDEDEKQNKIKELVNAYGRLKSQVTSPNTSKKSVKSNKKSRWPSSQSLKSVRNTPQPQKQKAHGLQSLIQDIRNSYILDLIHEDTINKKVSTIKYLKPTLPLQLQKETHQTLFSHQVDAIKLIRQGHNVLIATPTASGKSVGYLLPYLESVLNDKDTTGLFIFPMKALSNDQLERLKKFNIGTVAKYDGTISAYQKKKIRNNPPNALFTNPDTIHYSLLRTSSEWRQYLKNLKYIILDETHLYKGFFGSNVANIVSRLKYLCDKFGSDPQIICTSATINRGKKFVEKLTGSKFKVIKKSGAPHPRKDVLFVKHTDIQLNKQYKKKRLYEKNSEALLDIAEDLALQGQKVLIFVNSKSRIETLANRLKANLAYFLQALNNAKREDFDNENDWEEIKFLKKDTYKIKQDEIAYYHADLSDKRRRKVEKKFKAGSIKILFSTKAMEVGVDIGDLQICILHGIPHSNNEIWQRIGRAGRSASKDTLIIVNHTFTAIDRYFFNNPQEFMKTRNKPESPIIFPNNKEIRKRHLQCAYHEGMQKTDLNHNQDIKIWNDHLKKNISKFAAYQLFPIRKNWNNNLQLVDDDNNKLGTIGYEDALKQAHYGAIYRIDQKYYKSQGINKQDKIVKLKTTDEENLRTDPSIQYEIKIKDKKEENIINYDDKRIILRFGRVRVIQKVEGYIIESKFGEMESIRNLKYSDSLEFNTDSVWISFPDNSGFPSNIVDNQFEILHSLQHLLIKSFVSKGHSDWDDIAGITQLLNPNSSAPITFIYDNCVGGIKLAETLYNEIEDLLRNSYNTISKCPCQSGCRVCLLMKQYCKENDHNLNKNDTTELLKWIVNSQTKKTKQRKKSTNKLPKRGAYKKGDTYNGGIVEKVTDNELVVYYRKDDKRDFIPFRGTL